MRNVMVLAVVLALPIGACQEGGLREGMQSRDDEDTRDETGRPGMGREGGGEQRGVMGTHPLRPGLGEGTRPTDTLSGELQQHEGETGDTLP